MTCSSVMASLGERTPCVMTRIGVVAERRNMTMNQSCRPRRMGVVMTLTLSWARAGGWRGIMVRRRTTWVAPLRLVSSVREMQEGRTD